MDQRSEQHSGDADNREPAVKSVERGEEFAGSGPNRGNRAHTAEDHRCIEQRVYPRQPFEEVVAAYSECQRTQKDCACDSAPSCETPDKKPAGQQGLVASFEGHRGYELRLSDDCGFSQSRYRGFPHTGFAWGRDGHEIIVYNTAGDLTSAGCRFPI